MHGRYRIKNFYIIIFCFWYSTEIIFNTTLKSIFGIPIETMSNVINLLIFAMLMIQILFLQSYKKKELVIIAGVTFLLVCTTVLSDNRFLLSGWMFIVAAKNIDLDRIIYIAYKILRFMITMVALLCLLGFIEDNNRYIRWGGQRFSLGFAHPNGLALRLFQLTICYCYIHRNKLGKSSYLFILIAIILTVGVPKSQTAYISLIVFLGLVLIYRIIQNKKRLMHIFMNSLLVGAFLLNFLSIVLSFINVKHYWILSQVDKWMAERLSYAHTAWLIYGVSLFGQRVYISDAEREIVGVKQFLYLDNAYASILIRYGVLVFIMFSFFYLLLLKEEANHHKGMLVIILFLYALYGVMENGLYQMTHNIFLIAFANLLYGINTSKGEKENCVYEMKELAEPHAF